MQLEALYSEKKGKKKFLNEEASKASLLGHKERKSFMKH